MLFSNHVSYVHRLRAKRQQGFSLIELMVTVGIVVLVTGIALVRYGSFNNAVILRSQAFELALDIREAQLAGVSVRPEEGASVANPSEFRGAYGVYFNTASPGGENAYLLFLSYDDSRYDSGEAIGEPFIIDPRFVITEIVANGTCTTDAASVLFRRPNFNAIMWADGCTAPTSLRFTLAGTRDATVTRSVVVYESGLITVE